MAESTETPMSELLLEPLNRMQDLSRTLFQSLSPPATRPPPPPSASQFIECDKALAEAVQATRVHQMKQRRIEDLKAEILQLDARLMHLWSDLEQGKRDLEAILDEGDERLMAIEQARKGEIDYRGIFWA